MQEKFSDILRHAKSAGKKVIAKMKKDEDMMDNDINIESYDGEDAVYSGTDEEYQEFLKSVDANMKTPEDAEPVENTQKINLGETINIQGMIDKVKMKAVEFSEAAKNVKEDVTGKIEDFRAATAEKNENGESDGETRFERFLSDKKEAIKNIDVDGMKNHVKDSVSKLGDLKDGLTSITERFDASDEKTAEIAAQLNAVSEKVDEVSQKLALLEIQENDNGRQRAQSEADLTRAISSVSADVSEIKQAVVSVSKLNDSIFDLKNAQVNTKNSVAELEAGFVKLKRKCVAGVTILSILSAITIALEVVQLIS